MSLTEPEILDRHTQSLKEAAECCRLLARNADPDKIAPRGHNYGNLKRALKQLEGTCRQMNYFREDTRWLRLGMIYAKAMRGCEYLFANQNWLGFVQMTALFENGVTRMRELTEAKTGVRGPILPTRPSSWLVLPDKKPPVPMMPRRLVH